MTEPWKLVILQDFVVYCISLLFDSVNVLSLVEKKKRNHKKRVAEATLSNQTKTNESYNTSFTNLLVV
jgi:hypothetical protein